jgi:ribosomal-protein-serine acetyltransferase
MQPFITKCSSSYASWLCGYALESEINKIFCRSNPFGSKRQQTKIILFLRRDRLISFKAVPSLIMPNYRILSSETLTIRMAQKADAEELLKLIDDNRDRIAAYFPGVMKFCESVTTLQDHLQQRSEESSQGKYVIMLIFGRPDMKLLGLVQLKDIDTNAMKREIGAFIDRNSEARGLMLHALGLLLEDGFRENGINKFFLRTAENNAPARHLAEKLGFIQEGLLREDFRDNTGKYHQLVYYGLLKSDWDNRKG